MDSNKKPRTMPKPRTIPVEVIEQILTRVPAQHLVRFTTLSKHFRHLIDNDDRFYRAYLEQYYSSVQSNTSFLLVNYNTLSFMDLREFYLGHSPFPPLPPVREYNFRLPVPGSPEEPLKSVIGSVDGLLAYQVCSKAVGSMTRSMTRSIYILNPLIRQLKVVPVSALLSASAIGFGFGFGYSQSNKQYQLVMVVEHSGRYASVHVYALGSNVWKQVGLLRRKQGAGFHDDSDHAGTDEFYKDGTLNQLEGFSFNDGVHVDGSLYFVDRHTGNVGVFDLDSDKFTKLVQPPTKYVPKYVPNSDKFVLAKLQNYNGKLMYRTDVRVPHKFESSKYVPYKFQGSSYCHCLEEGGQWTPVLELIKNAPAGYRLIASLNGRLIVRQADGSDRGKIVFYEPSFLDNSKTPLEKRCRLKEFVIGDQGFRVILPHVNTLVSLKHLGEDDVVVVPQPQLVVQQPPVPAGPPVADAPASVEGTPEQEKKVLDTSLLPGTDIPPKLSKMPGDGDSPSSISDKKLTIRLVKARAIYDSNTVEVDVELTNGITTTAAVPSGASIGVDKALELSDGGSENPREGVSKAVNYVNRTVGPKLVGQDPTDQACIDGLIAAKGVPEGETPTVWEQKFRADAMLAVSLAVCKAGARVLGSPLYKRIAKLAGNEKLEVPVPAFGVVNVRSAATKKQYMILPVGAQSFDQAMQMGLQVYPVLKSAIQNNYGPTDVGDEGCFLLDIPESDDGVLLGLLQAAITEAGYTKEVVIGMGTDATDEVNIVGHEFQGTIPNVVNPHIGSVTEIIEAKKAGSAVNTPIPDLAVGLAVGLIKTGAPCNSEGLAKQFSEIEAQSKAVYAGLNSIRIKYPELPAEPSMDSNELFCRVRVRLPNGTLHERKFRMFEPIRLLWSFCSSLLGEEEKARDIQLVWRPSGSPETPEILDYHGGGTFETSGLSDSVVTVRLV